MLLSGWGKLYQGRIESCVGVGVMDEKNLNFCRTRHYGVSRMIFKYGHSTGLRHRRMARSNTTVRIGCDAVPCARDGWFRVGLKKTLKYNS
jgi:hypothetical protein